MKTILLLLSVFLVLSCKTRQEEPFDPRSKKYNDRAVEMMHDFILSGTPDTTGISQALTTSDSARVMFKNIVDSCQVLLDSAVMYSPDYYLYYSQKSFFYAYCADYEKSYLWIQKSLDKKDIPETRFYADMVLHKMGKDGRSHQ